MTDSRVLRSSAILNKKKEQRTKRLTSSRQNSSKRIWTASMPSTDHACTDESRDISEPELMYDVSELILARRREA